MPLFDYECPNCKLIKEILKNDPNDIEAEFCERCKNLMNRKFSASTYLSGQSEAKMVSKKLSNKMGSGNDDHAMPPHTGPRMYQA